MAETYNYRRGTFARFFRAVPGRLVSRFGTARYAQTKRGGPIAFRNADVIGGRRPAQPEQDKRSSKVDPLGARPMAPVQLDTEQVIAITHAEARKYKREYDKAVRNGDLLEVDEAAYVAYLQADAERAAKVRKRAAELAEKQQAAKKAEMAGAAKKKTKPAAKPDNSD